MLISFFLYCSFFAEKGGLKEWKRTTARNNQCDMQLYFVGFFCFHYVWYIFCDIYMHILLTFIVANNRRFSKSKKKNKRNENIKRKTVFSLARLRWGEILVRLFKRWLLTTDGIGTDFLIPLTQSRDST